VETVRVVKEFPGPLFSLAAFCWEDFDRLVERVGATADVEHVRSFGEVIDRRRTIYLGFSSGRFAALSKSDSQRFFEIALQRVSRAFYERELSLLIGFVGIADPDSLERYCNPPFRFATDPPSAADRKYWERFVGSEYPYGDAVE
jgi:hypothetical protein